MLFFGHRFIESENFYHITDIDAIKNTPPSSTLYVIYTENNLDIIKHLHSNALPFVLSVTSITELLYASALGARYITLSKEIAKSAQNIAECYLFDAKILVTIEDENEIEEAALLGIDGVLFSNAIIKINS
jgi:hypothetical protein